MKAQGDSHTEGLSSGLHVDCPEFAPSARSWVDNPRVASDDERSDDDARDDCTESFNLADPLGIDKSFLAMRLSSMLRNRKHLTSVVNLAS